MFKMCNSLECLFYRWSSIKFTSSTDEGRQSLYSHYFAIVPGVFLADWCKYNNL